MFVNGANGGSLGWADGGQSGGGVTGGTALESLQSATLATDGAAAGAGLFLRGGNLNLSVTSGSQTIAGDIADAAGDTTAPAAGSITKLGAGTLVLSGDSGGQYGYAGGTTVQAGTLSAANNGALGLSGVTVNSGATLNVADGITLGNDIALNGGTIQGTGTAAVSGAVTLGASSILDASGSGNATN